MYINTASFKLIFYTIIVLAKGDNKNQPVVEYYNINDDQYVFFSQKLTWDEASMVCLAHNGRLAVLDTLEKATNVAQAVADSNIVMRDAWIAGRRFEVTWFWTDSTNFTSTGSVIPSEPNIENFPPWTREPTRNKKECLAFDRISHSLPSFIDLDCRLPKPFICQKKSQDSLNTPVPSKWIHINKNVYILYHGQVTWAEAVTFCRLQGTRLAVIKNKNALNIITTNMIKARPDFESVWIGAHYSYGQWTWLSTGSAVNPVSDMSGYPPWRSGKPEKNSGCLLLDRHLDRNADFIEVPCDRKRDFVCEEYPPEESEEWENQPIKFNYQNDIFSIYPIEKTWDESRLYCQKMGGSLGYVDNFTLAQTLVFEMGDHPKEIPHLWLGGIYRANVSEWRWIHNDAFPPKSSEIYLPWENTLIETDVSSDEMLCLNLDKTDHTKPHFYGLDCESKQPFVCITDCQNPPTVANGEWKCDNNSDALSCTIECAENYYVMGLNVAKCSVDIGWYNNNEELNPPLCLNISDYVQRIVRSVSQDILKSSGYYVLLSHSNKIMQTRSFEFVEKLLNIFPLSNYLKMGMSSYFISPPSNIPYEQNDTCIALKLINDAKTGNHQGELEQKQFSDWSKEIMKNKKQKSVVVAILDSNAVTENQEVLQQLKSQGHSVITIGLKDDWEKLLPLATIGFEERINLYLFDEQEYSLFIDEFNKLQNKSRQQCTENRSSMNDATKPIAKEPTQPLESSTTMSEIQSEENAGNIPESKIKPSTEETNPEVQDVDHSEVQDVQLPEAEEFSAPSKQESKKRDDIYAKYHIAASEQERDSSESDYE